MKLKLSHFVFHLLILAVVSACGHVTAHAADLDTSALPVGVEKAFPNIHRKIKRPIVLTYAPGDPEHLIVASQLGTIYRFPNSDDVAAVKPYLDLSDRVEYKDKENEEGLLGLAFHPDFDKNGELYVYYTTTAKPNTSVISRFRATDKNGADPDSEEVIMEISQPFWNHNGGTIAFGPDNYLYVGLGDGGYANDPQHNGQNVQTLLGSILRIDVQRSRKDRNYGIPADNPFADAEKLARPEIWAYGIRNVWRIAFDRKTGKLWAGDVGQDKWEEINIIEAGKNYGWNLREGKHSFGPAGSPPRDNLVDPIFEYNHDVGKSITGGSVYRGKKVPALDGRYVYADYVTGKVWALDYDDEKGVATGNHLIAEGQMPIMSFGEDYDGEVYFLTDTDQIFRFVEKK